MVQLVPPCERTFVCALRWGMHACNASGASTSGAVCIHAQHTQCMIHVQVDVFIHAGGARLCATVRHLSVTRATVHVYVYEIRFVHMYARAT